MGASTTTYFSTTSSSPSLVEEEIITPTFPHTFYDQGASLYTTKTNTNQWNVGIYNVLHTPPSILYCLSSYSTPIIMRYQ